MTELWGHMWRAQARNGEPRASGVAVREENPPGRGEDVKRTEFQVGKCVSHVSRKAAIVHAVPVP